MVVAPAQVYSQKAGGKGQALLAGCCGISTSSSLEMFPLLWNGDSCTAYPQGCSPLTKGLPKQGWTDVGDKHTEVNLDLAQGQ